MFLRAKIRKEASDGLGLSAQEWDFDTVEDQIVLTHYVELSRPSKRHKERVEKVYDRIHRRENTISLEEVPLPADVAAMALMQITNRFRVVKEYTRG